MKPMDWWTQKFHDPAHARLFQLLYPEVTGNILSECDYESIQKYLNSIYPGWLSCYDSSFEHADFVRKAFARNTGRLIEWNITRETLPIRKLTDFELKLIFGFNKGHTINTMLRLIYSCGAKPVELIHAQIADLSESCRTMIVGKSGHHSRRWIPVPLSIYSSLMRDKMGRDGNDPVFSLRNSSDGSPLPVARTTMHKYLNRTAARFGLGFIGVQSIRNTYILNMLQYGVSVEELSRRMGVRSQTYFKPFQVILERANHSFPDMLRFLEKPN